MLVLSRRYNESIIIDHEIVITVVSIDRDKVRLGIAAPIETEVHREEVYRRKYPDGRGGDGDGDGKT
jgi:carbon storage regulator